MLAQLLATMLSCYDKYCIPQLSQGDHHPFLVQDHHRYDRKSNDPALRHDQMSARYPNPWNINDMLRSYLLSAYGLELCQI